MNRGRGRNQTPRGRSPQFPGGSRPSHHPANVEPNRPSYSDNSYDPNDNCQGALPTSDDKPASSSTFKNPENNCASGKKFQQKWPASSGEGDAQIERFHPKRSPVDAGSRWKHVTSSPVQPVARERSLDQGIIQSSVFHDIELSKKLGVSLLSPDEPQLPSQAGSSYQISEKCVPDSNQDSLLASNKSEHNSAEPFDICLRKSGGPVLKPSLLDKNRARRNEIKNLTERKRGNVLRSGMVLLKSYLSLPEQVNIVKLCQKLGLGSGGFYQPGYRDGAILHLKMMCLGKNWDPETSKYEDARSIDGTRPPIIPDEFTQLVGKAIRDSHSFIEKESKSSRVEQILPWMSSDICIVNFYSASGRLGLHQDRDESPDSLRKGLPVVSFSIGNSAEFLYGDERDVDKADKVVLESGDLLIFGGKSRHIFHGVSSILPDTAPKALMEQTNLRPGRLNLTFRQY